MSVISRGWWKGAFSFLGSGVLKPLSFSAMCVITSVFLFVSVNARKLHFTPFRWQTLFSVYNSMEQ